MISTFPELGGEPETLLATTRREFHNFAAVVFNPSDVVEVRTLPAAQSAWATAADLPELADRLLALNDRRQNIYIGANPRTEKGKRGNANIAIARTVFVDFDGGATPGDAYARIATATLPEPSMMLFSGGGVQCYWRLAQACDDLDAWEELTKDIIAAVGSDPAVHNPERLMRAPGLRNWKYTPAPEARIIDVDGNARFAFDHLRQIVPRKQEQERQHREQQAAQAKAARIHRRGSTSPGESVIDAFNAAHDIEAMLSTYGYTKGPRGRYIRPGGKTASVSVRDSRSCHHSSSDRMYEFKPAGAVCGVADAFDLYRVFEHGGDFTRAVKAAAEAMGMKAATSTVATSPSGDFALVSHRRRQGAP